MPETRQIRGSELKAGMMMSGDSGDLVKVTNVEALPSLHSKQRQMMEARGYDRDGRWYGWRFAPHDTFTILTGDTDGSRALQ